MYHFFSWKVDIHSNANAGNARCRGLPYRTVVLTHWGRVMHICVSDLTITGSDNGLLPGQRQAIIRTNAVILLIKPLGTKLQLNFYRNSNIFIQENAFENIACEMAAILSRPQCEMQWLASSFDFSSILESNHLQNNLHLTETMQYDKKTRRKCVFSNFNFPFLFLGQMDHGYIR